jgi:hypothetical protein
MKPLRPKKGERFVPPGLDTIFEWGGKIWVDTCAKAVPVRSEETNEKQAD